MPLWRIQTSLQSKSGLAADQFVNNLYVDGPEQNGSSHAELVAAAKAFYDAIPPGSAVAVRDFLSPEIATNGHVTRIYRMQDAKPRVPVREESWNLSAAIAGTPYPGEVAMCLSFEAAKVSGQSQARRRGRIYVGPLSQSAGGAVNSVMRPGGIFATCLRNAAKQFKTAVNTSGFVWVVYSPTTGPTSRAAVANVWTDDAFDTQRRRGAKATAKTKESVGGQIALAA